MRHFNFFRTWPISNIFSSFPYYFFPLFGTQDHYHGEITLHFSISEIKSGPASMQSCVLFSNSPKNLRYLEKRSSMRPNPYLIAIIIILFGLYCLVMYIRRWSTLKEQSIQQKSWFIASFVANKPFKAIYYRKFWPSDFLHPSSLDLNPHGSNSYRQMKSVACREYNQNMELLWVHIHVAWTTDILGKICMAAAGFHHASNCHV